MPDSRPPVVVVTGPTATGKTPISIELARRFDGEIVNADSMQVFRYMDIGTAKPTPAQRAQVPHHLLDVVTPDVPYSAGRYAAEARSAAARLHARGKIVFLTGGTGLYIRAFLEGLIDTAAADLDLREALEQEHEAAVRAGDPSRLHRRLAKTDPEAAARIHPNDARRVIRALEIQASAGAPPSQVRRDHAFRDRPYRVLHLALDLDRAVLNARIDARCAQMIEDGLLREMRDLIARGYSCALRPMQAIGYRHMIPVVQGSDILVNALAAMQRDTRRFARRQRTWLRAVPDVVWLDPREPSEIYKRVESFLASRDVAACGGLT
ncbi:MAG: tRNA (adenosine(37)-N6)-dimethylallyltransferase MiaA [Myxococcales bacterium]|nr:tRNA (adenosine(37)-N6)-dimethylallyltransferase MiaA [Myxococcales bacterium]MDH5567542.1 tRNA (adenosine(37)-N6)-dimethylallyltransferase MiaA [Myxococcales bacterium]